MCFLMIHTNMQNDNSSNALPELFMEVENGPLDDHFLYKQVVFHFHYYFKECMYLCMYVMLCCVLFCYVMLSL